MTFLYFTIYLILISWLAWHINEPKIKTDSFKTGCIVDSPYALTIKEQERVFYLLGQAGIKSEQAIQVLKNAMDKVCREAS